MATNRQIFVGSAIATDLVLAVAHREKPMLFSAITGLIYIITCITGTYLLFRAIFWLIDYIGETMFRGLRALCGS